MADGAMQAPKLLVSGQLENLHVTGPANRHTATIGAQMDGFTLDETTLVTSPTLPYLTMVASLIEGPGVGASGGARP